MAYAADPHMPSHERIIMPPRKLGRKTIQANCLLIAGLMSAALLSGCGEDKPVEQRGCDDPEVQTLAKKLVAMHFDETMQQKDPAQRQMDALIKHSNDDTTTLLNTIKSKNVDPNRVTLVEVKQIQSPDDRRAGNATPGFGEYLFVCSAKARIKLAPTAMSKVSNSILAKAPDGLNVEGDTIAPGIVFTTKADAKKRLEVGMALQNPLLDIVLGALLRDTVPDPRQ